MDMAEVPPRAAELKDYCVGSVRVLPLQSWREYVAKSTKLGGTAEDFFRPLRLGRFLFFAS